MNQKRPYPGNKNFADLSLEEMRAWLGVKGEDGGAGAQHGFVGSNSKWDAIVARVIEPRTNERIKTIRAYYEQRYGNHK